MAIVTGDRYLESLVKFVDKNAEQLMEGNIVLKLNPIGLHYVHSRIDALQELEGFLSGAPVDYLRAYISDLGDHRALEHLRRILRLLDSLKIVSALPPPVRDPTPLSILPFSRLRVLELRGCDLSTSPARGLLELRHTLEKIICHNSTNALRHVLASRIIEVKDSPQWKQLSFVSCACNNLVIMDDSLQLLPAVEILDISRNKFTKVDNLWRCSKLKHLDLGFNNIRTLTSFRKVPSHIVKLILRNNALASLHGIESLKSLEGLDLSFNIISSFLELGVLVGLSSLQWLWLEGNPLSSAPWYRAHVFTFFTYPHKVKIDGKGISLKEVFKRRIILASQKKKPSSYGLYSPAHVNTEDDGVTQTNTKKLPRIACIESGDQNTDVCSEKEAIFCNTDETLRTTTNTISEEDVKISNLVDRIELLKKEQSVLWLREFKEWMENESEKPGKNNELDSAIKSIIITDSSIGEASKHLVGVECSLKSLPSENSVGQPFSSQSFPQTDEVDSGSFHGECTIKSSSFVETCGHKPPLHVTDEGKIQNNSLDFVQKDEIYIVKGSLSLHNSSNSPPRYKEDILLRRRSFVDESLQRSSSSFSSASFESTSSENDSHEHDNGARISTLSSPVNACGGDPGLRYNNRIELDRLSCSNTCGGIDTGQVEHSLDKDTVGSVELHKRKAKRRVVVLSENSFSSEREVCDFAVPSAKEKTDNMLLSGCDFKRILPVQERGMVVGTGDFIVNS